MYFAPWPTQLRVHSAGDPLMCCAPHIASLTAPVNVCLSEATAELVNTKQPNKDSAKNAPLRREFIPVSPELVGYPAHTWAPVYRVAAISQILFSDTEGPS